jgi:hypothetical protein
MTANTLNALDDERRPQPTTPGPYHAVVRGPNGLDASVSGPADLVAAQLRALAEALSPPRPAYRLEQNHRDGRP